MTSHPASAPPGRNSLPETGPLPSASPLPAPARLPRATPRRRAKLLLIVGAAVVAAVSVVAVVVARAVKPGHPDLLTHTVRYDRLELTVVERGALESADNHDIYCRVKAG